MRSGCQRLRSTPCVATVNYNLHHIMAVVPLTLTISLCLVFTFVVFFLREHARGRFSSAERDSLLPLAEEISRPAHAPSPDEALDNAYDRPTGIRRTRPASFDRGS
jgi:hypothetical protein